MKHKARSKSWLCFQAKSGDDDPNFHQPAYAKDNMQFPSVSSENSLFSNMSSKNSSRSSRRSSSRRTFSRILKAVFFDASLKKSKKVGQDPYQALRNVPSSNKQQNEGGESRDFTVTNTSDSSSSITCSSNSCSSSSSSSNLSNLSEQRKSFQSNSTELQETTHHKKTKEVTKNRYSTVNGLCLLVVSLMALVLWGRICAVVCTSSWIYFGSLRPPKKEDEVTMVNYSKTQEAKEMESKEYKKKVIMGGLLERKHSRI